MTSAIAIITYRRLHALKAMLEGLEKHCSQYPIAIFEDCGNADGTAQFLKQGRTLVDEHDDLLASHYADTERLTSRQIHAFLGTQNLGVSGNSNRAIKWFEDGGWDHLCLCNDDLLVLGDFVAFYRQAHKDLGPGFFCFNDFWESPTHRWIIARSRGYRIKVFPRMTGIMMSITRRAISKVGYFDTRFGKFGEEHCDYTYRMRFAKEVQLDGLDQMCLDVEPTLANGQPGPPVLKHQEVETSVTGDYRKKCDAEAAIAIKRAAERYNVEHFYRPFALLPPGLVSGMKAEELPKYLAVTSS